MLLFMPKSIPTWLRQRATQTELGDESEMCVGSTINLGKRSRSAPVASPEMARQGRWTLLNTAAF